MYYTFCTLFDKNYLHKGLALYESLISNCDEFILWILCMDDITYSILEKMQLSNVKLIHLDEFEDEVLLSVKRKRSIGEYCWTCTPSIISYVIKN